MFSYIYFLGLGGLEHIFPEKTSVIGPGSISLFIMNFLYCIGVQPVNNVVIASGEQQMESAKHIYVSILPQTPLASRLPHNIEQSSLCCTVSPCQLSILNRAVCTCLSKLLNYPFPPATVSLFSKPMSLFLLCKFICTISFQSPNIRDAI